MQDKLVINVQSKQPTERDFWLADHGELYELKEMTVLTEELILKTIKRIPEFLMNLTEEQITSVIAEEAVKQNAYLYRFIPEQLKTEALTDLAIEKAGVMIRYVENPTLKQKVMAVSQSGGNLKYIQEQTKDICLVAVQNDAFAIDYVQEQTPDLCWEALKQSPTAISYIRNQDESMCRYAINKLPSLVREVQCYPLAEMYEALRLAPEWFEEIKGNKEDVYRQLTSEYPDALSFLNKVYLTESHCLDVVGKDAANLKFIPEEFKSLEVCMKAYETGEQAEPYLIV